eukprot:scpid103992/ scgid14628/ 
MRGVALVRYLADNGTAVCFIVRKNRSGLPKGTASKGALKKGEFVSRSSDGLLFVKLRDTKEVCFLSSMHTANIIATEKHDRQGRMVRKLALVHDYKFMGGVDRNDAMLSCYTSARKSYKWYKKLA